MDKDLSTLDEKVVKLWREGFSASEIGEILHMSKGAVTGKIFRLRRSGVDVGRAVEKVAEGAPKPKKLRPKKEKVVLVGMKTINVKFPPPKPIKRKDGYLKIDELKLMSCRYIMGVCEDGDHLYCGKEQDRGSYCETHAKLCYTSAYGAGPRKRHNNVYMPKVVNARK